MSRVTLIDASPRNATTAALQAVKLAGGGNRLPYPEGYRAGVAAHVRFQGQLGFDKDGWTGGTIPKTAALRFMPTSREHLDELAALYWADADITVQSGMEGGAMATALIGTVAGHAVSEGALVLTVADLSTRLDKPLITARFAGTGGVEGGAEAKDRVKRRSWGRCFNIEGRVLDKATNIHEFGALDFAWQSFDQVRDIGRAFSPVGTVAWQGSIAATLTALKAYTVTEGGVAVAPSIACVKTWTQPNGPLTADVRGEVGTGYVETVPEIVARILAVASGPAIVNVSAIAALRAAAAGVHVGDDNETCAQILDRALLGVSLLWAVEPAGTVRLREWSFAAPVETIEAEFVERSQVFAPTAKRRVGYQRNNRVQQPSEIAADILLASIDAAAAAKLAGIATGATKGATVGADLLRTPPTGGPAYVMLPAEVLNEDQLWVDVGGELRPEDGADVTVLIVGPPTASISCDYTGVPKAGVLPMPLNFKLLRAATADVTAGATWSATVLSGNAAVAIGASDGALSVTGISSDAVIGVSAIYNGTTRRARLTLLRAVDAPPAGTSGGGSSSGTTSASTSTITGTSTTTYGTANTAVLTVRTGPGGRLDFSAPLDFYRAANGTSGAAGKWQVRAVGGTFADVAPEVASTKNALRAGAPEPENDPGSIAVTMASTGLTADTAYEAQLLLRGTAASAISFTGTAAAVGS